LHFAFNKGIVSATSDFSVISAIIVIDVSITGAETCCCKFWLIVGVMDGVERNGERTKKKQNCGMIGSHDFSAVENAP
jgi:hypothetical protein